MSVAELYCPSLGKSYPVLMNVWPETAQLYGMSRFSVYEAINSGAIASIRIGGRIKVPTALALEQLGIKVELTPPGR